MGKASLLVAVIAVALPFAAGVATVVATFGLAILFLVGTGWSDSW